MRILFYMLLLSLTNIALAGDLYPFQSVQKKSQFNRLVKELRCLVCQNESLDASNAKLANDLRTDVYQMVQKGKTDQQIKTYMVNRYGDFVLFNPPFVVRTYLLWLGPFVMLLIGFSALFKTIRRGKKVA